MDDPARRHRQGRHHAPRRLRTPSSSPGSQVAEAYGETVVSERHRHRYEFNPQLPQPLRGGRLRAARARRPTGGWSSSSSSTATRSGSAPRPIPSSRAGPTGPHPLFRGLDRRGARSRPRVATPTSPSSDPVAAGSERGRDRRASADSSERVVHDGLHLARRRGHVCEPDGVAFSATSCAHPARWASCPWSSIRGTASVMLVRQYRPPLDAECSRSRRACATWRASRRRRPPDRELGEEVGSVPRTLSRSRCSINFGRGSPTPPRTCYLATGLRAATGATRRARRKKQ